jgi:hypothetical protein
MRKFRIFLMVTFLSLSTACSPRDFLTRRLAADLIAGSETFKATQQFSLRTGIVSNKDYLSPEYLVLRRHGWITGTNVACAKVAPPPCWEVALSPIGVETFRALIASDAAVAEDISVPVARRQLLAVTDISKNGNVADVDFQWKWVPVNEVGAALYSGGVPYNSTVGFRHYDDGWRLLEGSPPKSNQDLDDALKNAEPVQ